MAWVEQRVTRTSQPQELCGLDWGNPVTKAINFAWSPRSGVFNADGNSVGVESSTAATVVAAGKHGVTENKKQNGLEFVSGRAQVNNGFTCLYIGGHSAPSWSVLVANSAGSFRRWSGSYALLTPAGRRSLTSITLAEDSVVIASRNVALYPFRFWVNGVDAGPTDSSGGDTAGGSNLPVQLFQSGAGDRSSATYWDANCSLVVTFESYISDADAKSLSENPWQIYEPEIQYVWVDEGAGGGGVNATLLTTDSSDRLNATATVVSGIFANLTATETNDTSASTATVLVGATSATTDVRDALAATSSVLISATSSPVELRDTAAGAMGIPVSASSVFVEAGDTVVSSATAVSGISAALSATDGADTALAASTVAVGLTGATPDVRDIAAATASITVAASSSSTDAQDTLVSTATAVAGLSAFLAAVDGPETGSGASTVALGANSTTADGGDVLGSATSVGITTTLNSTDGRDTLISAVFAANAVGAALAVTDASDTLSASGAVEITALAVGYDRSETLVAAATADNTIVLSLNATDRAETVSASANVPLVASAAATNTSERVSAQLAVFLQAQLAAVESGDVLAGVVDNGSNVPRDPLRVFVVVAEVRTLLVPAESRALLIPNESRSLAPSG